MLMLQISRIWPNQPVHYCKCIRPENQSSQLCKSQDARHSTVTDPRPMEDSQAITSWPTATDHKYHLVQDVLYCKQYGQKAVLKPMLPSCIQEKVTEYMHKGHSRIKCIHQINWECHVPNLAHKLNLSRVVTLAKRWNISTDCMIWNTEVISLRNQKNYVQSICTPVCLQLAEVSDILLCATT